MYYNEKHKQRVIDRGDGYKYIGTYKCNEITIDGKNKKHNVNYIRVKCPYCGKEYDVQLDSFKRERKCTNCCHSYENSFAYYIQVELKEPLNKYWDWDKNIVNPYLISKRSSNKVWIKCDKTDYHDVYKITPDRFVSGTRCGYCGNHKVHPKDSFAQWLIYTYGDDAIEKYWSPKNKINPWNIKKSSKKKVWILCQEKEYHNDNGGYEVTCCDFKRGSRCSYCSSNKIHLKDSFGQWLIDTYGDNAIEKYWSPKNTLDPFRIAPNSNKKVWILCQEHNYHNDYGGYLVTPNAFKQNSKCPYCEHNSGKVHPKDSFGALYPEKAKFWSRNNKKSPYEVVTYSNKKYKFICEKCGKEFEKILNDLNRKDKGVVCSGCSSSQLEQSTKKVLDKYNIKYIREYYYNNLLSNKGFFLRFDFYLPNYNLLIECQGQQHIKRAKGWQTEESFKQQQSYDRRKKDYCKKNNIKLLEIWYYDIDNIEDILINELSL